MLFLGEQDQVPGFPRERQQQPEIAGVDTTVALGVCTPTLTGHVFRVLFCSALWAWMGEAPENAWMWW